MESGWCKISFTKVYMDGWNLFQKLSLVFWLFGTGWDRIGVGDQHERNASHVHHSFWVQAGQCMPCYVIRIILFGLGWRGVVVGRFVIYGMADGDGCSYLLCVCFVCLG
jgi:hypothetical protein